MREKQSIRHGAEWYQINSKFKGGKYAHTGGGGDSANRKEHWCGQKGKKAQQHERTGQE